VPNGPGDRTSALRAKSLALRATTARTSLRCGAALDKDPATVADWYAGFVAPDAG